LWYLALAKPFVYLNDKTTPDLLNNKSGVIFT